MPRKYDSLREKLTTVSGRTVTINLSEMDRLVGGLPESARKYRAWWANETHGRHVQAHAWTKAGWKVEAVDVPNQTVTFRRD